MCGKCWRCHHLRIYTMRTERIHERKYGVYPSSRTLKRQARQGKTNQNRWETLRKKGKKWMGRRTSGKNTHTHTISHCVYTKTPNKVLRLLVPKWIGDDAVCTEQPRAIHFQCVIKTFMRIYIFFPFSLSLHSNRSVYITRFASIEIFPVPQYQISIGKTLADGVAFGSVMNVIMRYGFCIFFPFIIVFSGIFVRRASVHR